MEKTDAEVAVLEKDMAPLDLHLSTCKQDLKCVLVALFDFHNRIVHISIKLLVIKNIKQKVAHELLMSKLFTLTFQSSD